MALAFLIWFFVWRCIPYITVVLVTKYSTKPVLGFAAAVGRLLYDLYAFNVAILQPRSSTAGLIYVYFMLLILFVIGHAMCHGSLGRNQDTAAL